VPRYDVSPYAEMDLLRRRRGETAFNERTRPRDLCTPDNATGRPHFANTHAHARDIGEDRGEHATVITTTMRLIRREGRPAGDITVDTVR